jgi:hypothetical protein
VIGDSHSVFWSGADGIRVKKFRKGINIVSDEDMAIEGIIQVYHLGPCLAYNINKLGANSHGKEKVDFLLNKNIIPKQAYIMTCFGEIDIRAHILKKGKSESEIRLYGTIMNYLNFVDNLMEKGYRVIVYGPIATQKDMWHETEAFPRYGDELERNFLTKRFNDKLNYACKRRDIPFVSLFYDMVDDQLNTRENLICDQCHASNILYKFALKKLITTLLYWWNARSKIAFSVSPENYSSTSHSSGIRSN